MYRSWIAFLVGVLLTRGLAITRRLIEAMGGHMSVESIRSRGSRLVVTIPRHARAEALADVA